MNELSSSSSLSSSTAAVFVMFGTESKILSSLSSCSSKLIKLFLIFLLCGAVSWSLVLWYDEEKVSDSLISITGRHFVHSQGNKNSNSSNSSSSSNSKIVSSGIIIGNSSSSSGDGGNGTGGISTSHSVHPKVNSSSNRGSSRDTKNSSNEHVSMSVSSTTGKQKDHHHHQQEQQQDETKVEGKKIWTTEELLLLQQEQQELFSNNMNNKKKEIQTFLTIQEATTKHPNCFTNYLLDIDADGSGRFYIHLAQKGMYVRKQEEQEPATTTARYDHISCFIMKARYNCAVPTTTIPSNNNNNTNNKQQPPQQKPPQPQLPAHSYKLVLQQTHRNGTKLICDLHQLITDIGGPIGLARHLLHLDQEEEEKEAKGSAAATTETTADPDNSDTVNTTTTKGKQQRLRRRQQKRKQKQHQRRKQQQTPKKKTILKFVLQGDSMLRQLFEAITCGWSSWITDISYIIDGPPTNQADLEKVNHEHPNQTDAFGRRYVFSANNMTSLIQQHTPEGQQQQQESNKLRIDLLKRAGCHGNRRRTASTTTTPSLQLPQLQKYYRIGAEVPPSLDKCSDDWAMVEFAHSIRFYYFFHLERFDDALQAYHSMGLLEQQLELDDDDDDDREKQQGMEGLGNIAAMVGEVGGMSAGPQFLESLETLNRTSTTTTTTTTGGRQQQQQTLNSLLRRSIAIDSDMNTLKAIQNQNIGRWYGADNPYIYDVPDVHSCMPGPIDDYANLVLFCLLRGVGLRLNSGMPSGWLA